MQEKYRLVGVDDLAAAGHQPVRSAFLPGLRNTGFHLVAQNVPLEFCEDGEHAGENSLHWVLDVTFREDLCRIRKDHAPQNFAIIRHAAINIINKSKGKRSIKTSRKRAGWNNAALLAFLTS